NPAAGRPSLPTRRCCAGIRTLRTEQGAWQHGRLLQGRM
ncbi:uncharacterized protein METZ01_LOCUS116530, partial [marine metagenome]